MDFHRWLADPRYNVLDWIHIAENLDRLVVRLKTELCEPVKTNNLPVAAFVTSHARLRLYKYIEQADSEGCHLLYCDTDSVIYAKNRFTAAGVVEGDQLGEMKREMGDRRILEFVAAGPKNYGLRHVNNITGTDERMMCKVRGFELNSLACESLNFETLKRAAFEKFQIDGHL